MRKIIYISIFIFSLIQSNAQVTIDNKLIMTSLDSNERTISGISAAIDTNDLVPVTDLIDNRLLFSSVTNDDSLQLNLPLQYELNEGMGFWISPITNSANTTIITLDQLNYFPLKSINQSNETNCLKSNEIEWIIYDGNSFQEMFEGFKTCPTGYVDVNTEYCIQTNENSAANYWNAIQVCETDGAKLCSWGEWYFACQKSGLGLSNMIDNWEWTESANNHASAALAIGNGSCTTAGESNTQVVTVKTYRCCYRKK